MKAESPPGTAAGGFSNILVIGLANDYEYRTRFERCLLYTSDAADDDYTV